MKLRSIVRIVTTKLHLYEPIYRIYSLFLQRKKCQRFDQEFLKLLEEIRCAPVSGCADADIVLLTGIFYETKKPTLHRFFSEIEQKMEKVKFIYLDEQMKPENEKECWAHHYMPRALRASGYDPFIRYKLTKEMKNTIHTDPNVKQAANLLYQRQSKDMSYSYACALACYYDRVYRAMIGHYKPKAMVIWCKFPALHALCDSICKEKGIIPLYMEYGSLPGTFALEKGGQMGESNIAINYRSFRDLPVTEDEMETAAVVLKYLRNSRLNRNEQFQNNEAIEKLKKLLNQQWSTVLIAGSNDFDSGLIPYDAHVREFHSPMFENSLAAVKHLAKLAEKMHFNLIYKPHPAMYAHTSVNDLPDQVLLVKDVDINEIIDIADVVVTIVSQVGYISCIREKATLTLGYNQLRGKGATYEAYSLESIPQQLEIALQKGFTGEMADCFQKHVSQMLCYGLYDDLTNRPIRYGRSPEQAAHVIRHFINYK